MPYCVLLYRGLRQPPHAHPPALSRARLLEVPLPACAQDQAPTALVGRADAGLHEQPLLAEPVDCFPAHLAGTGTPAAAHGLDFELARCASASGTAEGEARGGRGDGRAESPHLGTLNRVEIYIIL